MHQLKKDKGATLIILTFVIMVGLSGVLVAYLDMVSSEIRSGRLGLRNIQAFYIAEAGRAKARWTLTTGGQAVGWGESVEPFGAGQGKYIVTTAYSDPPANQHITITSDGYIPDNTNPVAKRRVVEKDITYGSVSTNLSLSATAMASSEQGGNTADKANDGKANTKWMSGIKGSSWLRLDFGSSTTFDKAIYTGNNINSCTIEYSNNDVDYYPVTNAVESPAGTVNFDSVSARYLRFNMVVDSSKKAEINELESYNTTAGSTTLGQGEFSTAW